MRLREERTPLQPLSAAYTTRPTPGGSFQLDLIYFLKHFIASLIFKRNISPPYANTVYDLLISRDLLNQCKTKKMKILKIYVEQLGVVIFLG
jgi:hypothetical protein